MSRILGPLAEIPILWVWVAQGIWMSSHSPRWHPARSVALSKDCVLARQSMEERPEHCRVYENSLGGNYSAWAQHPHFTAENRECASWSCAALPPLRTAWAPNVWAQLTSNQPRPRLPEEQPCAWAILAGVHSSASLSASQLTTFHYMSTKKIHANETLIDLRNTRHVTLKTNFILLPVMRNYLKTKKENTCILANPPLVKKAMFLPSLLISVMFCRILIALSSSQCISLNFWSM